MKKLTAEQFFDLPEYPNYRVSNYARFQTKWEKNGHRQGEWRDLIKVITKGGSEAISLINSNGERKTIAVHILMANLFIRPLKVGEKVRWRDNIKTNNTPTNLYIYSKP